MNYSGKISGGSTVRGTLNSGAVLIYQGEEAVIDSMRINAAGELIVKLVSGTEVNLGQVKGEKGDPGEAAGFGTPTASVSKLSANASPTVKINATGSDIEKVFSFEFGIPKGDQGDPGIVFTPSIDSNGNVSWTNNGGLDNPETVNIKGQIGDRGKQGYYVYSVYKKSGTGMPGSTDIYGVKINDEANTEVGTFSVYNGADGEGVGDMVMTIYDSNGDGVVNKSDDSNKLNGQSADYYAKVDDIPTVPQNVSAFENDAGYITSSAIPSNVSSFANDAGYITMNDVPDAVEIPTKISSFENDKNYVDNTYVDAKCASLVDSAPETLDTLNELAAALGNDPNYATTTARLIGEKVPRTRMINNHELTNDIELSATDIGAATISDIATHIENNHTDISFTNNSGNIVINVSTYKDGALTLETATVVPAPATSTSFPTSGTALTANTIYTVSSAVGTYKFVAPASGWAHGVFTTGTSVSISFGTGAKYIGEVPEFEASTKYEFDVFNNVWVFAEVVS